MNKASFRKLLNSRINKEELRNKPEISDALENEKIIRFDFLSPVKPKFIDTKGFKNEKKKNMVEDINSFKQIYYKDYMINKSSLEKIYKISNENNIFLNHFSGFNKNFDNKTQKEILKEIQLKYKKKMGFSPTLNENGNLFSHSILLQNEKDLKQYISLDLDTIKKDSNSISFLKNMRNKLNLNTSKANNFLEKLKNEEFNNNYDNEEDTINVRNNVKKYNSAKVYNENDESVDDLKRDINKTKECVNSIDNLNYFLENYNNENNKNYWNHIQNIKSRKNSMESSTRMNSGVKMLKIKLKINDFYKAHKKNKSVNVNNTLYKKEINEYNYKNNNTVNLPLIKANNNITYSENKSHNNLEKSNDKETKNDYIKITEPNKYELKRDKNKANSNKRKIKKKKVKIKKIDLRKPSMGLEKLYETLSKTEDFIGYNKEIENYLKYNNYKIKEKINSDVLYKTVDQSRRRITDNSSVKKNYDIMINNKFKSYEQNKEMILNSNKIKKNIENIEERMIDLLCEVNNQNEDN